MYLMGSWIRIYSCLSRGICQKKANQPNYYSEVHHQDNQKTVLGLINVVIDKVC